MTCVSLGWFDLLGYRLRGAKCWGVRWAACTQARLVSRYDQISSFMVGRRGLERSPLTLLRPAKFTHRRFNFHCGIDTFSSLESTTSVEGFRDLRGCHGQKVHHIGNIGGLFTMST